MDYNDKETKQMIINILKSSHGDTHDNTATEIIKIFNGALANEQTQIFEKIMAVILGVEVRCMTHDTVTPTLDEMTEGEMRKIWLLALKGGGIQ